MTIPEGDKLFEGKTGWGGQIRGHLADKKEPVPVEG